VEFALVLPLVLLMGLALIQVGVLVKDGLVVQDAARAGAREAAVTTDEARVRQAVVEGAGSLDPGRLEVSVQRSGGAGTPTSVTVTYHAPVEVPLVGSLFPDSVDLAATVTMRQETEE
jgi:Flp pilus assembly protein TadG